MEIDNERVFAEQIITFMTSNNIQIKLKSKAYIGHNKNVISMQRYLNEKLKQYLVGAYLHGSLSSEEVITYSDFDALVIIKKEIWNKPSILRKIRKELQRSEKLMYKFDPLQHHGWFILNESDLDNYPEHYLPVEVLRHASSLFPDIGVELDINPIFIKDKVRENFINLANGIKGKIKSKKQPKNIYHLKGLFSQFMLLPALYVQVRDDKGVYKKQSFDLARRDFTENEWAIMDEVSNIRLNWHYSINALQRWFLTRTGRIRTYYARYMPIAIPTDIKARLTPDFFQRMESLVVAMERKVL